MTTAFGSVIVTERYRTSLEAKQQLKQRTAMQGFSD
jgi:hypothetical protein